MKIRSFITLALLALLAAACGSEAQETVTGDTSTTEESAFTRIVSLNPTATEMLFAIGAGDLVVAVDEFSYYPPEAPVTDLSGWDPNIEAIAGFEPDLVVTESPMEGLDAIDVENHVISAATTLGDIYAQITELGGITGHSDDAATLVTQMQTDIDAVLSSIPEREEALTYYHELDDTLYSVTSTTFIGYVYDLLGLRNVADPADADGAAYGYPQLNEEYLVDADPDVIFLADTRCCAQTAETVAARPGWDQLTAVQEGNIVELDDDVVSRWGPRVVEFIEVAGTAVAGI
ncbi:MAG: ABC transporter substrate-binding protein [Acidimicrobiales bacterium]|nr:MAG: ABC transporter substrate-binding protein [Acidimicrobiales bacterium]